MARPAPDLRVLEHVPCVLRHWCTWECVCIMHAALCVTGCESQWLQNHRCHSHTCVFPGAVCRSVSLRMGTRSAHTCLGPPLELCNLESLPVGSVVDAFMWTVELYLCAVTVGRCIHICGRTGQGPLACCRGLKAGGLSRGCPLGTTRGLT